MLRFCPAWGWGTRRLLLRRIWPLERWLPSDGFLYSVAAVRAVGLRDISVIHGAHLPNGALPRNLVATPAILAARMARSSLLIR